MSARLLVATTPLVHTLADDLESFLHVLSWVALRFTPHGLTTGALTATLEGMFEQAYEDDGGLTRGGITKMNYLIATGIRRSNFKCPMLAKLLVALTKTCAVRYEETPSDEELEIDREQAEPSDMLRYLLAIDYKTRMAALDSSDWMIKVFTDALADRDAWPPRDKSAPNKVYKRDLPERKKKTIDVMPQFPTQKQRFSTPTPEDDEYEDEDEDEYGDL